MFSTLVFNGQPLPSETPDVRVPWWSVTKTVLAATALSLVRDGLTTLDAPVAGWPFTLRQLLRHEAGLADYGELPAYHAAVAQGESAWPVTDMLQRLEGSRLRYTPGTHWRYSNVGYWHVGTLIEQLTGLPLEDAVSQRVLHPLGLSGVRFAKTRDDVGPDCLGLRPHYDPAWVYHGLLIGPLSQAALLLDRLLAGDLLSADLLGALQDARTLGGPLPGRPWVVPGYGLGVMHGMIAEGRSLCGHTGCGPDSVIAVYWVREGAASACCAVFGLEVAEGAVETEVVGRLATALPT
ncbi:beta-lactamase family protein [Pseudomonas entomophila]|jgi:CubicO group peptidase (beta-lactamase class C family)|uniref:serine hydrolase domain-containing protein n=1 Tax=Pseudomonas entomophila TaxID=312306 RepID=UPI0015E3D4E7|nr:serine hydrolase domain-containing protein [Pseudomonas entomophila]MBA1191267.1 beta-lactamase family protein [Pseudomonas entomophila]